MAQCQGQRVRAGKGKTVLGMHVGERVRTAVSGPIGLVESSMITLLKGDGLVPN